MWYGFCLGDDDAAPGKITAEARGFLLGDEDETPRKIMAYIIE